MLQSSSVSFEFFVNYELISSPLKNVFANKSCTLKSFRAEIPVSFISSKYFDNALLFYHRYLKPCFATRTAGKFSVIHNYISQWLAVGTFLCSLVFVLDTFWKWRMTHS